MRTSITARTQRGLPRALRNRPLRWAAALALLAATALPAGFAAELKPDAPDTYVVQPGDTLWSIAARYLDEPWRWREVWRSNTDIANPSLIYPGDVLRVTTVDGQPRIGVDRGGAGESVTGYRGGMRVVKLSPRVRTQSLKEAVPTIPIASVAPFLTQPYVADSDAIKQAPYVVGFPDEHIVAGVGDAVYVRRIDGNGISRFQILRPGSALIDPDTNEILGYEALFVANSELERTGDPAKLRVVRSEREVSIGDRVLPAELEEPLTNFFPRPAPAGMRGRILSVLNGVSQIGRFDVVVLNKGTKDGIERGHVFEVFRGGSQRRDLVRSSGNNFNWREEGPFSGDLWLGPERKVYRWRHGEPDPNAPFPPTTEIRWPRATYIAPYERSGVLMVFRTFPRVSFALVLESDRSMQVEDRVAAPSS